MKLVAWNLGHQTVERPLKPGFFDAIRDLAPDLLTLNEYVHGASRGPLMEFLRGCGLPSVLLSERLGKNNQVLIACRHTLRRGDLRGPQSENGAAESNFLHVVIPAARLEVVGVRAPAYEGEALQAYWVGLQRVMRSAAQRSVVFIGDLNTDPRSNRRTTSRYLRELEHEGWTVTDPSGPWSFIAGTRIDHAVASKSVPLMAAEYVTAIGTTMLAGEESARRVSDHAALVVQLAKADCSAAS